MDFRSEQLQISDNLRDLASRIRNAGDADTVIKVLRETNQCVEEWATYIAARLQQNKG
jgi:hypothetical protein